MNVVALATCRGVGDTIQSHIAFASVSWDEATLQIADQWIAELELLKLCDPCQSQRHGGSHWPINEWCQLQGLCIAAWVKGPRSTT
jgi:hypothetical protein